MIDQGLKERLTGAVVLMVLGVIFIPLLLDGPDNPVPPSTEHSLELPAKQSLPVPAAAEPGLGRASDAAAEEDDPRQATAGTRAPESVPVADVPSDPLSAWAVQVGSFTSQDNAERLAEALKQQGYRAFVTRTRDKGRTFFRVRVGPEQDKDRAEALARRLQKDGQTTAVLRHP